jgi:hypothetical protein
MLRSKEATTKAIKLCILNLSANGPDLMGGDSIKLRCPWIYVPENREASNDVIQDHCPEMGTAQATDLY